MQEAVWARRFRGAIEASWLLAFAVLPLYFSCRLSHVFVHDKIPLFRSLVELGLLAALMGGLLAGVRPARLSALGWVVGAHAAVLLVATLCGRNPSASWWGLDFLLFGTFTLLHGAGLFVLMASYMTSPGQRRRWAAAALAAAVPVSLYAIAQRMGWDPYGWTGPIDPRFRPISTLGNPSHLAGYMVFVLPLALAALVGARRWLARAALAGLVLLQFVALAFTLTRGAWVAAAALLLTFGLLLAWHRGCRRLAGTVLLLGALGLAGIAALNLRPQILGSKAPVYLARLANLHESAPGSSGWERLQAWQIVIESARGPALWLGHGPESYTWVGSRAYRPERSRYSNVGQLMESPHNIFLDALVNTGLLGVGALAALLGAGFVVGLRTLRRVRHVADEALLIAALSGLAGYVVQGMFYFDHLMQLLFVMGFLAVIASIARSASAAARVNGPWSMVNQQRQDHRPSTIDHQPLIINHRPSRARRALAAAAAAATGWCVVALNLNESRADAALRTSTIAETEGGDLDAAERAAAAAERLCPWRPSYPVRRARLCLARAERSAPARGPLPDACRKQLEGAERHLRRAVALEPADYRSYLLLGDLYTLWSRYEPVYFTWGVQAYRDAAATTPRRQQVYWHWGKFYASLNRWDDAVERFRYALALDPATANSHRMLAVLHAARSELTLAEQEYAAAWALELQHTHPLDPEYAQLAPRRAAEHAELAERFLAAGEKARAIRHLREVSPVHPESARTRALLEQRADTSCPPHRDRS